MFLVKYLGLLSGKTTYHTRETEKWKGEEDNVSFVCIITFTE
jgi:hypothetical protein